MSKKEKVSELFPKKDRMSPRMEGFIRSVLVEEPVVELDDQIDKYIGDFLKTVSPQVESISGFHIIEWMVEKGLIPEKKRAEEVKKYMARQSSGRGIKRRKIEDFDMF